MTLHLLLGRNMNIKFVTCFRAELRLCYCLRVRLLLQKVISYYCIRQTIGGLALLNTSVCMYDTKLAGISTHCRVGTMAAWTQFKCRYANTDFAGLSEQSYIQHSVFLLK